MNAYTVYEVTRRADSEYPTFAGLQIEEEEIIDQGEANDVIRVKVPGCGAQFEQALNGRNEVVEFKEVERNWFKAYDYQQISKTPIVKHDGRWLKLLSDYSARPDNFVRFSEIDPFKLEELEQEDDVIAARSFVLSRGEENLWVGADEDGYYFAVEVNYHA